MAHLWNDWNSIEAAFRDSMPQHRFSVIILHFVRTLGILQDEHLHTASAKSTSNGRLTGPGGQNGNKVVHDTRRESRNPACTRHQCLPFPYPGSPQ